MNLRSDHWIKGDDEVALDSRVALRMAGADVSAEGNRPIIGIANSSSDLNPCNQPLAALVAPLKESIANAGGVALEFPVMSLGEDLMKPTAMLYRNLLAMELEESIRSQPLDAVIILAGCDKSVPGALMGAFSTNVPVLLMVAGPRPTATFEGKRIGTGTDLWRLWDQRRSGELSDERWAALEKALTLGKGTCNTMGTASSMGAICEALGLAFPGSTSIPAGDPRHDAIARLLGQRCVELVRDENGASNQVTPGHLRNALITLCAIGGSTNAVIHLTAMARRLGHDVRLDELDQLSRTTPVLVDVEPSGTALMQDLDDAGGLPTLFRELGERLDPETILANGATMKETQSLARSANGVVRSLSDPVDAAGAFRVVSGNLAPDGALIKRSAASESLLSHRGPAYVIASHDELAQRTGPDSHCPEDAVLVFARNARMGHDPNSRTIARTRGHRHGARHGRSNERYQLRHGVPARRARSRHWRSARTRARRRHGARRCGCGPARTRGLERRTLLARFERAHTKGKRTRIHRVLSSARQSSPRGLRL